MRKKKRRRIGRILIREETEYNLIPKVKKIANELGLGEERQTDNGFLTHCPCCHKKGVLQVQYNGSKNEIEYKCDTGCSPKELKKTVISKLFFARPAIPSLWLTKNGTKGGSSSHK